MIRNDRIEERKREATLQDRLSNLCSQNKEITCTNEFCLLQQPFKIDSTFILPETPTDY